MSEEEKLKKLEDLINSPELEDFLEGVKLESTHQTLKWGNNNEKMKYPHDFSNVLTYLHGKLIKAVFDNDLEKYKHHLITISAVCYNAHKQIKNDGSNTEKYFHNT